MQSVNEDNHKYGEKIIISHILCHCVEVAVMTADDM